MQESNLLGTRATGSSLANWPVAVPATLHISLNPEEPKRVERSKPISRTCPLSRREGLPLAQQLHLDLDRGERENRTPVALIALASAFQAGTLPLGHLSTEEPGRVERPWPISRTNPLSRREGLPLAQQLQEQATRDSNPAKAGFGDRLAPCALPMMWTWRDLNTLPPACKTGALPGELQAHVSEWGILPSRPPAPEAGALLSELHSVSRGDRRDLNSLLHAFTAHGLDSSPSIAMVGTEGVEPFVDRLSSDCTEPLCYVPSSLPFSTPQGEGAIKLAALDIPFGDAVSRDGGN